VYIAFCVIILLADSVAISAFRQKESALSCQFHAAIKKVCILTHQVNTVSEELLRF